MSEPQDQNIKLAQIYDVVNGWYQSWYFELRVEEETSRSERYRIPLSVVVIHLGPAWNPDAPQCISVLRDALKKLRRSDIPGITGMDELAICLTHTTREQAEVVIDRVAGAFQGFEASYGLASLRALERGERSLLSLARESHWHPV